MAEPQAQKLDGWKAIAQYLGKDTSTVTRWARRRGMPIHRPPGAKGATVYAFPEELDAWLERSSNLQLSPSSGAKVLQDVAAKSKRLAWPARYGLLLVPALLLASVAFFALASRHTGLPAQISFNGNKLSALDERGRPVWEHEFNHKLEKPSFESAQRARFADLDGDGRQELLVAVAFPDETMRDIHREALYCFSPVGKLLWSYAANNTLTFPGRSYEGPWLITDILIVPDGNRNSVWVSLTHHTWWPSFLVKLDISGKASVQFVDSGAIYALTHVRTEAGSFILAGGVNNEYGAGMLAVIDEREAPAVSPQTPGSAYACDNCSHGQPYRYFVFPRSELNLLDGDIPYNPVRWVRASESQIEVACDEVHQVAALSCLMNRDFTITSAAIGDGYADLHRRLSQQGKIAHPLSDCPLFKQPYAVRVWDAEHGWSNISIPWIAGRRE